MLCHLIHLLYSYSISVSETDLSTTWYYIETDIWPTPAPPSPLTSNPLSHHLWPLTLSHRPTWSHSTCQYSAIWLLTPGRSTTAGRWGGEQRDGPTGPGYATNATLPSESCRGVSLASNQRPWYSVFSTNHRPWYSNTDAHPGPGLQSYW